jgi:hypothetical protein
VALPTKEQPLATPTQKLDYGNEDLLALVEQKHARFQAEIDRIEAEAEKLPLLRAELTRLVGARAALTGEPLAAAPAPDEAPEPTARGAGAAR